MTWQAFALDNAGIPVDTIGHGAIVSIPLTVAPTTAAIVTATATAYLADLARTLTAVTDYQIVAMSASSAASGSTLYGLLTGSALPTDRATLNGQTPVLRQMGLREDAVAAIAAGLYGFAPTATTPYGAEWWLPGPGGCHVVRTRWRGVPADADDSDIASIVIGPYMTALGRRRRLRETIVSRAVVGPADLDGAATFYLYAGGRRPA